MIKKNKVEVLSIGMNNANQNFFLVTFSHKLMQLHKHYKKNKQNPIKLIGDLPKRPNPNRDAISGTGRSCGGMTSVPDFVFMRGNVG